MPGYSGTPLAKKLGIKPGMEYFAPDAPPELVDWLEDMPAGAEIVRVAPTTPVRAAHLFVTERAAMEAQLAALRPTLDQAGFVWVSWPKKAARVPTDITEETIREVALPMGYVDIKVCAVSEIWSGLKLVIRRSERT
ncbi:MAG TPA: hypothetical protein VKT77_07595 [Chthonomonadaceae bacterium]|nr:hypothetical protein [Chthonomonadaceae bacterium]